MRSVSRSWLLLFALFSISVPSHAEDRAIRVAILADDGAGERGINNVTQQLGRDRTFEVVQVTGKQIANGILSEFDVVVFTGGSGSRQGNALGETGRENVRTFVRGGGGYIGICAGAYLACSGFDWGVGVLNAKTVDPRWRRGTGNVKVEFSAAAAEVTGLPRGVQEVRYANGPILIRDGCDHIPPFETVAFFRTELAMNGSPPGVMMNSPAVARGTFGKGRVVVASPHLESTEGLKDSFVPTAVRWVAGKTRPSTSLEKATGNRITSAELGERIQSLQKKYSVVGLSAVAVKNGSVAWHTNFGLADIERAVPVTDRTKFRIASISKTITTTAVMQLWEKGKFKLDDDISSYLGYRVANPKFPQTPITFRHLLTHTSSLTENSHYDQFLQVAYNAATTAPDLKELLCAGGTYYNDGASFSTNAPGKTFDYSNLGFGVLGTLVEMITGERFHLYCSKNILKPLGMEATFNPAFLPEINDLAVMYSPDESGFKAENDNYKGVKPADRIGAAYQPGQNALVFAPQGGLRVSALDLSKFMVQFMDRKPLGSKPVLKKSTIDMMLREQWTNGEANSEYRGRGLGFQRTQNVVPGETWIGHTGSAYGLYSSMFFLPKESTGVILITNGSKPGAKDREFYLMQREIHDVILQFANSLPDQKPVLSRR